MRTQAKWVIIVVVLALGGGLVAQHALARERHGHEYAGMWHGDRHVEKRLKYMREALELSDEQVAAAQKILFNARKQGIQLRADLRVARLELEEAFAQDTVEPSTLDPRLQRIDALRQQILRNRVNTRLALRAMLTPEQRAKARTLSMDHFFYGRQHGVMRQHGGPRGL